MRLALLLLIAAASVAQAKVFDRVMNVAGTPVYYKIVLPRDFDPAKTYPGVLAFPPGSQGMDMVQTTVLRNWLPEAERRGYIVVTPSAPLGKLFVREGAQVFPAFLDQLLKDYKIRDGKFYAAGMSNGGLSAFHIAATYPQYFYSVTGFPGYLPNATPERVNALKGLCLHMFVGELDTGWLIQMEKQASELRSQGFTVSLSVEKGQGHVMSTLTGAGSARLFDQIETSARGCAR